MTDFPNLTNDELKEAGQAWFAEVESRLDAADKNIALRIVKAAHKALNVAATLLVSDNEIQPLSGDDKED